MLQLLDRSGHSLAPLPGDHPLRELQEVIVAVAAGALAREQLEPSLAPRIVRQP